jgi:hypothetical protein
MSYEPRKTTIVFAVFTAAFSALAVGFVLASTKDTIRTKALATTPAPSPATVRISAGELKRSGGDTSGLDCYACHDEKKSVDVTFGTDGRIVLPKEHADLIFSMRNCVACHGTATTVKVEYTADGTLIMPEAHRDLLSVAHGRSNRNDHCFNCHNPAKLDQLVTRDGTKLKFEEATQLCASCHGPSYRDWEAGIHGRTTGYWNRQMGPSTRAECTSCHDPHAPAFPQLIPLPGPRSLHDRPTKTSP